MKNYPIQPELSFKRTTRAASFVAWARCMRDDCGRALLL
jgi:hypothetical protein